MRKVKKKAKRIKRKAARKVKKAYAGYRKRKAAKKKKKNAKRKVKHSNKKSTGKAKKKRKRGNYIASVAGTFKSKLKGIGKKATGAMKSISGKARSAASAIKAAAGSTKKTVVSGFKSAGKAARGFVDKSAKDPMKCSLSVNYRATTLGKASNISGVIVGAIVIGEKIYKKVIAGESSERIIEDATVDATFVVAGMFVSMFLATILMGPIGLMAANMIGIMAGIGFDMLTESFDLKERYKKGLRKLT